MIGTITTTPGSDAGDDPERHPAAPITGPSECDPVIRTPRSGIRVSVLGAGDLCGKITRIPGRGQMFEVTYELPWAGEDGGARKVCLIRFLEVPLVVSHDGFPSRGDEPVTEESRTELKAGMFILFARCDAGSRIHRAPWAVLPHPPSEYPLTASPDSQA